MEQVAISFEGAIMMFPESFLKYCESVAKQSRQGSCIFGDAMK